MATDKLLRNKKLVNVDEVAKIMGVSKRSVWRFRAAKQMPQPHVVPDGVGGNYTTLWKTQELRRWIAKGCPSKGPAQRELAKIGRIAGTADKLLRRKNMISLPEMVRLLGVSRRTIFRFIKRRQIPLPRKVRNKATGKIRILWKTQELRRWIAKGCPTRDTVLFETSNPIHTNMLSGVYRKKRVLKMKSRVIRKSRR